MLALNQNGQFIESFSELEVAVAHAIELLGRLDPSESTTLTIKDCHDIVLDSFTNRRIKGAFIKQEWGGRKGDDALFCGAEDFDATDAVLLLDHGDLIELENGSENTDEIGQNHVSWDGPCEVAITSSICQYFGVDDLESITPEHLALVRARRNPQPMTLQTLTLTVKVKVRVAAGASVSEFIENLDYDFTSNTPGVVVSDTEIVDTEDVE